MIASCNTPTPVNSTKKNKNDEDEDGNTTIMSTTTTTTNDNIGIPIPDGGPIPLQQQSQSQDKQQQQQQVYVHVKLGTSLCKGFVKVNANQAAFVIVRSQSEPDMKKTTIRTTKNSKSSSRTTTTTTTLIQQKKKDVVPSSSILLYPTTNISLGVTPNDQKIKNDILNSSRHKRFNRLLIRRSLSQSSTTSTSSNNNNNPNTDHHDNTTGGVTGADGCGSGSDSNEEIETTLCLSPVVGSEKEIPEHNSAETGTTASTTSSILSNQSSSSNLFLTSNDSSITTTAITTPTTTRCCCIGFSTVSFREYSYDIGDNPTPASGPSLTIVWEHHCEYTIDIDRYESIWYDPRNKMDFTTSTSSLSTSNNTISTTGTTTTNNSTGSNSNTNQQDLPRRRIGREMLIPREIRMQTLRQCGYSYQQIIKETRCVNIARQQRRKTIATLGMHEYHEAIQRKVQRLIHVMTFNKKKKKEKHYLESALQYYDDHNKNKNKTNHQKNNHSISINTII